MSDMYTASATNSKMPLLANGALCLSTPKHNGKSGTDVIIQKLTDLE